MHAIGVSHSVLLSAHHYSPRLHSFFLQPSSPRLPRRAPPFFRSPPPSPTASLALHPLHMSARKGQLVLGGCCLVTGVGIWYITTNQQREKERMHRAVEVDKRRLAQIEEEQRRIQAETKALANSR
jgi:hypothetical protein